MQFKRPSCSLAITQGLHRKQPRQEPHRPALRVRVMRTRGVSVRQLVICILSRSMIYWFIARQVHPGCATPPYSRRGLQWYPSRAALLPPLMTRMYRMDGTVSEKGPLPPCSRAVSQPRPPRVLFFIPTISPRPRRTFAQISPPPRPTGHPVRTAMCRPSNARPPIR